MTPQSNFTIVAPIVAEREKDLRALLSTMNRLPGLADPDNRLVPFGKFNTLHFARFVILKDETLGDLERYYGAGAAFYDPPIYLAFLGDCDGPADALLADFSTGAEAGLRQIFAFCEGFHVHCDLLQWMRDHSVKPSAVYVNTIGRTVIQIREEAELHQALGKYLSRLSLDDPPRRIRDELIRMARENDKCPGPAAPTPFTWQLRRMAYALAAVLAVFLALLPVLTVGFATALLVYGAVVVILGMSLAVFILELRRHETTDPDVQKPPTAPSNDHLLALGALQDYDVTNQYTALGSFKPGLFARWTTTVIWWLVNLATPILYSRGNLARIRTIHFARWVFLDGKRSGFFASNYDGSSESYLDDFVNKVFFGLNLTFGQGLGYPRTHFLLWGGAQREQEFKNVQRRHALPTEVWYKAYPGLTLVDIDRNTRIRQGLERGSMTDTEIREWLAEI
jgi:hypothetical protein